MHSGIVRSFSTSPLDRIKVMVAAAFDRTIGARTEWLLFFADALLRLDVGGTRDLGPLVQLARDEGGKCRRRSSHGFGSVGRKLLLHVGRSERLRHLRVQARE